MVAELDHLKHRDGGHAGPTHADDAAAAATATASATVAATAAATTGCTTNAAVSQRTTTVERSRFRQHRDVQLRRRRLANLSVKSRQPCRVAVLADVMTSETGEHRTIGGCERCQQRAVQLVCQVPSRQKLLQF